MLLKLFILVSLAVSGSVVANLNNTSCPHDVGSGGGRMSRGVNFVSDEKKYVQSKREPRLFSFETEDEDVNIRMEFGVPFITIPTKRTIDGLKSFIQDAMQGEFPKPSFNKHGFVLIGLLCLGFSGVGIIMDQFNYKQYVSGHAPFFFFNRARADDIDDADFDTINIWPILEKLDKTLSNYNVDTTACVQHGICMRVQESFQKVAEGSREMSNVDIILEGITRSDWIMRYISGTAIEDAIRAGRSGKSCDKAFSTCTFNLQFLYSGVQNAMNNVV